MPGTTVENINIEVKTNAGDAAKQFSSLADAIRGVEGASKAAGNAGETVASSVKRARKDAEPLSAELQSAIKNATKVQIYANKATQAEENMYKAFKNGSETKAWREREKYLNADAAMQRELGKDAGETVTPLTAEQQALVSTADAVGVLTQKLESLKEAQQTAFQNGDWDKAWQTQGQILSTQAQLDRVANAANDAGKSSQDAAPKVFSLKSAVQGLVSALKKLLSHGNHAAKSIHKMGSAAKSSTGFMGKLFNSIKRIALYRLLRTFIKELSQAFQEGLKNAYAFSRGINGSLATALDHLASVSGQMKNQMGAAFGELLQTIMPIIEAIVSAITRLMSALSALFAALGGRMQYLSAGDTAESWDKATGAAKKYKNTILGFDEINRLNDENGGGGGSDNDIGSWEMADLPDWAEKIRLAIASGNWTAAGTELANHINGVFNSFDANKAGNELGSRINNALNLADGFLSTFNFTNVGEKIAGYFNGITATISFETLGSDVTLGITGFFDSVIGFIEEIDTERISTAISDAFSGAFDSVAKWLREKNWDEVGTTISDKVVGFFRGIDSAKAGAKLSSAIRSTFSAASKLLENIDFADIAETISEKVSGFITSVDWIGVASDVSSFLVNTFNSAKTFVDSVDWATITQNTWSAIIGFIDAVDWGAITEEASRLLASAISAVTKFVEETDWETIGTTLFDNLMKALKGIDYDALASSVFELLGAALGSGVKFLFGVIEGVVEEIKNYFLKWIRDENEDGYFGGKEIFNGICDGIVWALDGFVQWVDTHVIRPIVEGFCKAFGINSPSTVMRDEVGTFVGDGLLEGVLQPFKDIYNWIKTNVVDPFVSGFKSAFGMDGDGESITFKNLGEKIVDGLSSGFKSTWDTFYANVQTWWSGLKTWWDGLSLKTITGTVTTTTNANGFSNYSGKFATGGTIENNGSLFVAGEAGPEIVANMGSKTGVMNVDQMESAVANGNIGVINAIYGMANAIVRAVESIDTDITLDGESVAEKLYRPMQSVSNRHGAAMVT